LRTKDKAGSIPLNDHNDRNSESEVVGTPSTAGDGGNKGGIERVQLPESDTTPHMQDVLR